nr:reverse transcriptase domain-containing protein [Tanacetum cinerariifolium]
MWMVVSTIHEAVKFHTTQGVRTVFSTHESNKIKGVNKIKETSPTNTKGVLSCTDAEEKIMVNSKYPEQIVTIEKQLSEHFKERLRNLLVTNADVFVWTHADMTGILRTITVNGKPFNIEHKLNEYSHIKPIKQKRRSLGPDRSTTTRKDVEDLTRAGILREAVHQTWVANPVMVKKNNGGWRMCVDFTDMNKAYPKDCYPLPEIDWKVESLSRFPLKCFLDAYKGYHQIQIAEEDEDKTAFFTGEGVYCYRKMPFGLKMQEQPSIHGEVLMMYLVASIESINAALFVRMEKGQVPVYFVSRVIQGAELNYPALEKIILALVHVARRLGRYFQAYTVTVLTNSSIRQALINPEKSGRVAKWAIELGEHDIVLQTRYDSNKDTPNDLLIKAPPKDNGKEVETCTKLEETNLSYKWKLYTDGASSSNGLGAGLMLIDPEGKEYTYALRFKFETTNNEAEYEALLAGLRIAQEMEIVNLEIFVDSQV